MYTYHLLLVGVKLMRMVDVHLPLAPCGGEADEDG